MYIQFQEKLGHSTHLYLARPNVMSKDIRRYIDSVEIFEFMKAAGLTKYVNLPVSF